MTLAPRTIVPTGQPMTSRPSYGVQALSEAIPVQNAGKD